MHLMRWRDQRQWVVFARRQGAWRSTANVLTWGKSVERNVNAWIALMLNDKVFIYSTSNFITKSERVILEHNSDIYITIILLYVTLLPIKKNIFMGKLIGPNKKITWFQSERSTQEQCHTVWLKKYFLVIVYSFKDCFWSPILFCMMFWFIQKFLEHSRTRLYVEKILSKTKFIIFIANIFV